MQAAPGRIAVANGSCATASFADADPEDGHLWVNLEIIGGGSGALAQKDGLDGVHVHMPTPRTFRSKRSRSKIL